MDVHRCRFVPYPPARINALAFSQTSGSKGKASTTLRLAIGRANGDIEIWNPLNGAWHHETTCRGGKDRSVDNLVWTQEPDEEDENGYVHVGQLRLFSSGHSSAVTEWDLLTGLPLRHSSGSHSEVWSLCAQPPWRAAGQETNGKSKTVAREDEYRGQHLVAGCADGTLVLLSTADEALTFAKYIARSTTKKARAVSVTFQNRDVVVSGYADSTIRVYDTWNGAMLRSMSLGAGPRGGPKEIIVWDVKCLPNGTVVSADSTGEVRFWDGKNYAQLQRIKGHEMDAVALVASADGETLFSGGLDRRTVVYRLMGQEGGKRRWANFAHTRMHKHDVTAMAAFDSGKMSIVVSGGVDAAPVIFPLREYGKENHRVLPNLPQQPMVASAPAARLLISWWEREIHMWRIDRERPDRDSDWDKEASHPDPKNGRLVGRIALKGDENISSLSISHDGKVLAVSTAAELKLFELRMKDKDNVVALRVRKIDSSHKQVTAGARLVRVSPDGKWLASISHSNRITMARFASGGKTQKKIEVAPTTLHLKRLHRKTTKQNGLNGAWGRYDRTVTHAAFSTDSKIFVTGDLAGHLDTWVLEGQEDERGSNSVGNVNGAPMSASSSSASSDSEEQADSESESSDNSSSSDAPKSKRSKTVMGQRWTHHPASAMLPKLSSTPLILSFKPPKGSASSLPRNGNSTDPASRHDQLLAVTATHQLHEFNILDGRLSDWSRGNPAAHLPEVFRVERDRAMGCVWDVRGGRWERVWLYGAGWLCMLDLGMDLRKQGGGDGGGEVEVEVEGVGEGKMEGVGEGEAEREVQLVMKKRKREEREMEERKVLRRGTSGAGSRRSERERGWTGAEMRDGVGGVLLDRTEEDEEDDDEDGQEGDEEDDDGYAVGNGAVKGSEEEVNGEAEPRRGWWMTHKYRPILGIVPLTSEEESGLAGPQVLEVALVERPPWEVDLPPRFEGLHDGQDWR